MKTRKLILALMALALCVGFVTHASAEGKRRRIPLAMWTGATTDTTAVGMADSTGILETNYQQLWLYVQPDRACRVAVQIRTADTLGTSVSDTTQNAAFYWQSRNVTAAAAVDSVPSLAHPNFGTSVVAGDDEFIIEFPAILAGKWGGPRGVWIPIAKVDNGVFYWSRHSSIRLRVLTAGGVVTWKAGLEGVGW